MKPSLLKPSVLEPPAPVVKPPVPPVVKPPVPPVSKPPVFKPVIRLLIKRAAIFVCILAFLTLAGYGVGAVQGFREATLQRLLWGSMLLGIGAAVLSAGGFLCSLSLAIIERKPAKHRARSMLGGAGYLVLGLCGLGIAFGASFIQVLTIGNAS